MECNQKKTKVTAIKTLYENFWEEKCEGDLLIPDYFPAVEKIIQCSAVPVIASKEIVGDRLSIQGTCRFCVIYQGEETGEIKSLVETVPFEESFALKESGTEPWAQTVIRSTGTSCRLLNPRKINFKSTVSIALKVRDQYGHEVIEEIDCNETEALFQPTNVYTIIEHVADTVRIQGEIDVHTEVQDVLKAEGSICIKDTKVLPGKLVVKGVANIFVIFTPESDPCEVEQTSTAIPFSQVIELKPQEEQLLADVSSTILTTRCDVEADDAGKNRLITVGITVLTEGEIFENRHQRMLKDVYSLSYPLHFKSEKVSVEEVVYREDIIDHLRFEIPWDGEGVRVIQAIGTPVVQRVTGHDNSLSIEGVLDASMFVKIADQYRSFDKVIPFTLNANVSKLSGRMRCEAKPCVLGISGEYSNQKIVLNAEMLCSTSVYSTNQFDVISEISMDVDHPLEVQSGASLVVYFAEKGEQLWDIARKYSTSVSMIKAVNGTDQDILDEKRLLLISRN